MQSYKCCGIRVRVVLDTDVLGVLRGCPTALINRPLAIMHNMDGKQWRGKIMCGVTRKAQDLLAFFFLMHGIKLAATLD